MTDMERVMCWLMWVALLALDAALGLSIASSATVAGWVAYGAGCLLWVLLVSWLLLL